MIRKLQIGGVSGGLGAAAWILGGPLAGLLAAGAGWLIADSKFPSEEKPWKLLSELLNQGEHGKLEFKEQFSGKRDDRISKGVIKTIAGFANTNGGELLIGISDQGKAVGIDKEIIEAGSKDDLESSLHSSIRDNLGNDIGHLYRVRFERYEQTTICRIEICAAKNRVFAFKNGEFYKRHGNQTVSYSPKDIHHLDKKEDTGF